MPLGKHSEFHQELVQPSDSCRRKSSLDVPCWDAQSGMAPPETSSPLHTAGVDREREILKLLADGVALKEIAARLDLSVKTVDAHKTNLMRKLDLHASSELIKYAIQRKLIRLSSVDVKGGRSSPARLPDRHRPSSHS